MKCFEVIALLAVVACCVATAAADQDASEDKLAVLRQQIKEKEAEVARKREQVEKLKAEEAIADKEYEQHQEQLDEISESAKSMGEKVFSSKRSNIAVFGMSKKLLKMRKALGEKDETFLKDREFYPTMEELAVEGKRHFN